MPAKSLFPTAPTHALFLASNQLSDIARNAASESRVKPYSSLVAILFSAAWLEAGINEAIQDLVDGSVREQTEHVLAVRLAVQAAGLDERFVSLDRKLRVLCAAATKKTFEDSMEPWPGVSVLMQLRNWMVHLRPERLNVREGTEHEPSSMVSTQVHSIVSSLVRVGAIKEVPQGVMVPVTQAAQLPGVGEWAYRVAYLGLHAIDEWMPERYHRLVEAYQAPAPAAV